MKERAMVQDVEARAGGRKKEGGRRREKEGGLWMEEGDTRVKEEEGMSKEGREEEKK